MGTNDEKVNFKKESIVPQVYVKQAYLWLTYINVEYLTTNHQSFLVIGKLYTIESSETQIKLVGMH